MLTVSGFDLYIRGWKGTPNVVLNSYPAFTDHVYGLKLYLEIVVDAFLFYSGSTTVDSRPFALL